MSSLSMYKDSYYIPGPVLYRYKKTYSLSPKSSKSSREENYNPDDKYCSRDSCKAAVKAEKTQGIVWRWKE